VVFEKGEVSDERELQWDVLITIKVRGMCGVVI